VHAVVSIFDRIAFQATIEPHRPAIILADRVVTYAMLAGVVDALTGRLVAQSLPRGGLVGVKVGNPARHLALLLALRKAGLASVSFVDRPVAAPGLSLVALVLDSPTPIWPGVRAIVVDDEWFAGSAGAAASVSPLLDDETCRVILSSGTTGVPKPIRLTPKIIGARVGQYLTQMSGGGFERLLCVMTLASAWGFCVSLAALCNGKTLMLSELARETLDMAALYCADRLVCSAHQLRMLLELQEERLTPCDALRWIDVGGSVVSVPLRDRARRFFSARLMICYGATETGRTAYAAADALPPIDGATGFVAPWATIEAIDASDRPLPRGAEGRLRLRSEGQAYWGDVKPGDEAPWFYPGDVGFIRLDGCVVVTGRDSEIINVGGVKVAPTTIEEALLSHPDVAEAAVVGVIGSDGVEQPYAAIVPRHPVDEAALRQFCQTRLPNAAPSRIFSVPSIPRVGGGKVPRAELRETLMRLARGAGAPTES
jgi:acyl-coenzyme A synthetase/AMP-(fatty) acid ligase